VKSFFAFYTIALSSTSDKSFLHTPINLLYTSNNP